MAEIALPDRISFTAVESVPARSTICRLGDAATYSTSARDVSDLSSSTTVTPSPRMTGWLKTVVRTAKAKRGTPKIRRSAARSRNSQRHSRAQPAEIRVLTPGSLP
jgi:hypothetical protein